MNLYGEDLTVNTDEHIFLEGDLSSVGISESQGGPRPTYSTLDEPIRETIFRDLKAVSQKFKHVIIPVDKSSLLSDWDLWGPLILCTFMAFVLENSEDIDHGPAFAEFFALTWLGSIVVTVNIKLLGNYLIFSECLCHWLLSVPISSEFGC